MRKIFSNLLAVAAFALSVGAAQAASLDPLGPYYSAGTCTTGDISGGADACFGAITNGTSVVANVNVNQATFDDASGSVTGLFGITDWVDVASGFGSAFNITGGATGPGTFDLASAISGTVAIMIDNGAAWAAYLFSNGVAAGTYSFDLTDIATGHQDYFRIIQANPIPVPAALPMLAGALGGLVLVGRRRRKAVA